VTIVVDASLALKWVLPEELVEEAWSLLQAWRVQAESLIAPPIFRPEVANALHQSARRGTITGSETSDALGMLIPTVVILEPPGLYPRALTLAGEFRLGAVYDALYVALAEHQGCELWTADRRLVRAVQSQMPLVRWVGEVGGRVGPP
jgi:predicted nucleic acid-binding protein